MKNKKNGFTLVELLAVIVVLGLILIIAVPKITSTMESSKKKTLVLTAKSIARSAEEKKMENEVNGIEEEITCDNISDYSSDDFSSCIITFDEEGKATVLLVGKNSYKGLYVCNGTKINATVQKEECASNTLVSHIKSLYNDDAASNGLIKDNTEDENIRYSGGNNVVKNYVEFGNTGELWRIIGIFEVQTPNGLEELVKIVREDSIGNIVWDTSDSTINNGFGINQWGESGSYEGADLMRILNGNYLNKQNAENACYNYETEEYETCYFSSIGMNSAYKDMIETVVWNTGAIDTTDTTIIDLATMSASIKGWYNSERGTTGKICSATDSSGNANNYCNDTVVRTSEWEGLVALPYATDWGYASSDTQCNKNSMIVVDLETMTTPCKNNNWMHYGTSSAKTNEMTWFLTPIAHPEYADVMSVVYGGGAISGYDTYGLFRVRPTVYLKSNIQIEDGDGSSGNAYKLSA